MITYAPRAAIAVAAAALLLGACGDSDDKPDEPNESKQTSTAPSTAPVEPTSEATEPAPEGDIYPTEAGDVSLPGNVRIADLGLTCKPQPSKFGGTNGTVSIEGANTTDIDFGRLRINFEVTGGGAPAEGYTNLPAFLPADELAYVVPTTVPEGATGCEVTGVEGSQPADAPPVSFNTEGATCEVLEEESQGYWNYKVDVSGIDDFPVEGANVSVALVSQGKIFGYQEPSLAAGETTSSDLTTTLKGKPTCVVKVFTLS